ncbi:DUF2812 domain-containing protein [Aminipila terrae]|uniref:DUF2812 domain-containing protein n=1 Tax=Aminipila terrae TaxID=2697030 RepID=A0A6P1MJI4_9FIRM|nr:DUF2812 domain-containing protein [Aminipila terrae]QHI71165.1 DUF2812 domain-containing protein [Aminipila terrae]
MKKFKLYLDKDEEENWLNEMAKRGFAFNNFFLGIYSFEPCKPGEYNYQIDLLDNWHGDKSDFSCFMEDSGVEVVSQWYRWIFIRKKASEGAFQMYTDGESKIAQYTRIRNFFTVALIIEAICFLIELTCAVQNGASFIWTFVALLGLITLTFLRIVWKCNWKIKQLKNEI